MPVRLTDRLVSLFTGRMASTPEPSRRPEDDYRRRALGVFGGGLMSVYNQWLMTPENRERELRFYDQLATDMPEVDRALDAFTTMASTGAITGQSRGTFSLRYPDKAPPALREWMEPLLRVIRTHSYSVLRGMAKYGSFPAMLVIEPRDGVRAVVDLEYLPPAFLKRHISADPDKQDEQYWTPSIAGAAKSPLIPRWKVPHFAIWTDVVTADKTLLYGTSLLKPVGAIAMKLAASIDAMVVARLTRATLRLAWQVDVNDIRTDEARIMQRLNLFRDQLGRDRQIMTDGSLDSMQRAPIPDEDVFVPAGENLKYGLTPIQSDNNLAKVDDIKLLSQFYFGAIGVPPEYLGHQREGGGRSALTQVDINFARMSRHLQMFFAGAMEHVIAVHMILGGWDPEQYPIECIPPTIGARDDLLQAQVRVLQSQVLANLVGSGFDPSADPAWTLRTILNMEEDLQPLTDEIIKKLFVSVPGLNAPEPRPPAGVNREAWLQMLSTGTGDVMLKIRSLLGMEYQSLNDPSSYNYRYAHPDTRRIRRLVGSR